MAGYAFARMEFPGRDFLFILILGTMMVPGIVTVIPKFILLKDLHLLNSYGALDDPVPGRRIRDLPDEAVLRKHPIGTSRKQPGSTAQAGTRSFASIVLPNAIPAVTALTIFSFQGSWNSFLEPVLFISGGSTDLYTLPVGLANFRAAFNTNWPVLMAISVITTVPMAIFFVIFQRYFIASNVASGIKG